MKTQNYYEHIRSNPSILSLRDQDTTQAQVLFELYRENQGLQRLAKQ